MPYAQQVNVVAPQPMELDLDFFANPNPNPNDVWIPPAKMKNWKPLMPQKKVKKDPKRKALDAARGSLRERVSQLYMKYQEGGGLPRQDVDGNMKRALNVMNGMLIREDSTGEIVNSLLRFIEAKGYVVIKNQLLDANATCAEYIIARSDAIGNRQFYAVAYDGNLQTKIVIQDDDIRRIFKHLDNMLGAGEQDRYSIRNGFSIKRSNGQYEADEVLFEWKNTKKFFGKKKAKRASFDKVVSKIKEARMKLFGG